MTTTADIAAAFHGQPGTAAVRPVHEHGWSVESCHPTSQGEVLYVRCSGCGVRRVDLVTTAGAIPQPYSIVVKSRPCV